MEPGVSAVERALQLARSGSVRDVAEIIKALDREGYNSRGIEGAVIRGQLRDLTKLINATHAAL